MPEVTVERRSAPRHAMVLAAEVIELPRGAKLSARTADISRTGCYIDTLNPIPPASRVLVRITHNEETFEAEAHVVYVSYGLGTVWPSSPAKGIRWLAWIAGSPKQTTSSKRHKLSICGRRELRHYSTVVMKLSLLRFLPWLTHLPKRPLRNR
jgi:PilZ domain